MPGTPHALIAQLWDQISTAISAGYGHAPAIMIGLAALLVFPPMALIGLIFSRRQRMAAAAQSARLRTGSAQWAPEAWIELEGGETRCPIGHGPIRIGRNDDNEICLEDTTVHRYHAVIQRTFDSGIVLKDVSGPGGNGVRLNGARIDQAVLADGDVVQVGTQRLRIGASTPISADL